MNDTGQRSPEHPDDPGLDLQVTNLVNRVGSALEATVTTGTTGAATALIAEASELMDRHGLSRDLKAARLNGGTWEDGFWAGGLHGLRGSVDAYLHTLDANREDVAPSVGEDRLCRLVGGWLATLQIGAALRLLAATESSDEVTPEAIGYQAGLEFALERTVGTFQARLERRVIKLQGHTKLSGAEQRLSTLLFVALTEPSRFRVLDSLGAGTEAVLDALDESKLIACVDNSASRPLRVTDAGAAEAFRLTHELATSY